MSPAPSALKRKWRNRRNEGFSMVTMALHHRQMKFLNGRNELDEEQRKLQAEKEQLRGKIAEYQALEASVRNAKNDFLGSVVQLREETKEVSMHCSNSNDDEKIKNAYDDVNQGFRLIRWTDFNLNVWQDSITPVEIFYPPSNPVRLTVNLVNIDPNGSIIKNGGTVRITTQEKCTLCVEKMIDCYLKTCGHRCCCMDCANKMQEKKGLCPVCRSAIKDVIKLDYGHVI